MSKIAFGSALGVVIALSLVLVALPTTATIPGWRNPELIEFGPEDIWDPDIAVDRDSNAIAVWEQQSESSLPGDVFANRFVPGKGWGLPVMLESLPGWAALPQVSMEPNGTAIAVWNQDDGTRFSIFANWFVPGAGWGGAQLVETNDTDHAWNPQVALDAAGNAIVTWRQFALPAPPSIPYDVWASRFVPGVGWGQPILLETTVDPAWNLDLAMNSAGNATAVWEICTSGCGVVGGQKGVWASRYETGIGWGTAMPIDSGTGSGSPQVAVDPLGNAFVVWYDTLSVWSNRYDIGAGWGTPTLLGSGSLPQVAAAGSAEAMAVWEQQSGSRRAIWASRHTGTGWGTPEIIDVGPGNSSDAQVDLGPYGATAVWWQEDGADFRIAANRFRPVAGWGTPEAIENLPRQSGYPVLASSPDGNAFVVWESNIGGSIRDLYGNVFVADDVGPQIVMTSPSAPLTNNPTVRVEGRTEPRATVSIAGAAVPVDAAGTFSLVDYLPDGTHTFDVVATDVWGNSNRTSVTVTVDTIRPALALASPIATLTNDSRVTVAGTTDPGATVTINGTAVAVDPGGGFSDTVLLADGTHTFDIVARDSAGNEARATRTITVDTLVPALTVTRPSPGSTVSVAKVTVSGTTEPGVSLVVNGLGVPVNAAGSFAFDLALTEGANVITATATDQAGNANTISLTVTYVNPIPGLEQDLRNTRSELNATRDRLTGTQGNLTATQQQLDVMRRDIAALGGQIAVALGLLVGFAVLVAAILVLHVRLRRTLSETRREEAAKHWK